MANFLDPAQEEEDFTACQLTDNRRPLEEEGRLLEVGCLAMLSLVEEVADVVLLLALEELAVHSLLVVELSSLATRPEDQLVHRGDQLDQRYIQQLVLQPLTSQQHPLTPLPLEQPLVDSTLRHLEALLVILSSMAVMIANRQDLTSAVQAC